MRGKAWHVARRCSSVAPYRELYRNETILIDAVLSSAAHYSKISNLPQFTNMHLESKKKTIAITTGLLAYMFTNLVVI